MRAWVAICLVVCVLTAEALNKKAKVDEKKKKKTPHDHGSKYRDPMVDRMLALKELHETGLIDDAQFHQMKEELIRELTGLRVPDEDIVRKPGNDTPPTPPNPANVTYSLNLQFLLSVFTAGLPRSYVDVLPDGQNFWTTPMYLVVGAIDPYGNQVPLDSQIATQERTLTRYGLNLYDGATWQIALWLEGLGAVAEMYERNVLYTSTTGPLSIVPGGLSNIRANKAQYLYGAQAVAGTAMTMVTLPGNVTYVPPVPFGAPVLPSVKQIPGSYFYRMIGPFYSMPDPFDGSYANAWKFPWPNNDTSTPWNTAGEIHWNDWKPITGENVWGCIIGPIQSLWIMNGSKIVDFTTFETTPPQMQFALSIMPALNAMVTPLGGLYHCPKGTEMFPADPSEETNVSNENNFSGYAAMTMMLQMLTNKTGGTSDPILVAAIHDLGTIITATDGWFEKYLLDTSSPLRVVYQGGHVTFEGVFEPLNISHYGGLAVDCQTWGMTVIGQANMDSWYGAQTAYNIWETTKKFAGYYTPTGVLGGVGYTQTTGNLIWSAEWTWGAINMAKKLSYEYGLIGQSSIAASLAADALSMETEVVKPVVRCANGAWCGGGLQQEDGSYLYANERFFIPWGWYANPIGATCSTAWAIMNKHSYNPFMLGGGFVSVMPSPTTEQWAANEAKYNEMFA